ncbi:MAG: hypothetical protein UW94_C0002G0075 [Parcubacteria group bacterium GW2011_GWA2_45_14]|nr:MAG: hypothetical protein UW94_C0002G0075 [Parcubacteria group bacterium GW2011_GWA2_45_14]
MSSVLICRECEERIEAWDPVRLSFHSFGQNPVDDYCTNCLHIGDIPGIIKIPDRFVQPNEAVRVGTVKVMLFRQTMTA